MIDWYEVNKKRQPGEKNNVKFLGACFDINGNELVAKLFNISINGIDYNVNKDNIVDRVTVKFNKYLPQIEQISTIDYLPLDKVLFINGERFNVVNSDMPYFAPDFSADPDVTLANLMESFIYFVK